MMFLTVILVAVIAFLIGFLMGVRKEPPIKIKTKVVKPSEDIITLQKEYENFLSYDGSVQQ